MAEITHCPSCQRKLSVPETLLGQSVQCPTCSTTFTASLARPNAQYSHPNNPPATPPQSQESYPLQQPSEPSPSAGFDAPSYDREYPERMPYSSPPPPSTSGRSSRRYYDDYYDDGPDDHEYYDDHDDYDEGGYDSYRRRKRRDLLPHRGDSILIMGIFSLVSSALNFCYGLTIPISLILGIITWVMANHDMGEIKAGRMDPSGDGNIQAGRVCAIIGLSLTALQILFVIALILVFALA